MIGNKKFFLVFLFIHLVQYSCQNQCNTKLCRSDSEKIQSKLDKSVSPCDDFYSFACGQYKPAIASDKSEVNEFTLLQDMLDEQLNETMSENLSEKDITPLKLVKNFFRACLDKETINRIGLRDVEEKMKFLGGWPVIKEHKWNEKKWSWQQFVQNVELAGFKQNFLFGFGLTQDLKNETRKILIVDQPALGLNREFLLKGYDYKLVKEYHSFQIDMAVLYGADQESAQKEMKEVLDFEIALANITKSKEERRDITKLYNLITVRDLQLIFPCINWLTYMNSFIPPEKKIDKDEILMITHQDVFVQINKLLADTPKHVIANYQMWRIALSTSSLLDDKIRERRLIYMKSITGVEKYKPRWKECVSWTTSYLPIASSALYVRKNFNEKSKHDALELVNMIRDEFADTLKKTEWMDQKTREKALDKAKKMINFIGYPDELKDDKKLTEYYDSLEIDSKEFLKSLLKLNRFATRKEMSKFRERVNKTDWEDHADVALVNAFYALSENSIQFPAGILQGQFFNADRPKYMNYGSIGFIIGHEITHGFDDQGRRFNSDGNLVDWWQEDTKKAYLEKAQCIIEQYGNYTEPTTMKKLNGVNTQGENIADNGGLIVSYNAYQNWVKKNGIEETLPGLDFTPNQYFWLAAAQAWCGNTRVETMRLRIETDTHSPPRFRVNGVMGNSKEFLNDFQCSESSNMNRQMKCKVW